MAARPRASVWAARLWRMAPNEATKLNRETRPQRDTFCIALTEQRRAATNEEGAANERRGRLALLGLRVWPGCVALETELPRIREACAAGRERRPLLRDGVRR